MKRTDRLRGSRSTAPSGPDQRRVFRTVAAILSQPTYGAIAFAVAAGTVLLSVVPENWRLVRDIVLMGSGDLTTRLQVFVYLLPGVGGVDPMTDGGVLAVSALSGMAVATLIYQVRTTGGFDPESGGVGLGVALGVVSGGCAACGSVVVATAFGTGAVGLLAVFPFDGAELLWIAAGMIAVSLRWIGPGLACACSTDDR